MEQTKQTKRDWAALGLSWEAGAVARQYGDNATDRRTLNITAQIPKVVDIDLATAAGIDVLAWVNSANSPRVMAQDVARKRAEKSGPKATEEELRELVFTRLKGVRNVGGRVVERVVEKKIRTLPNGQPWEGDDEMEFRAEYAACLIDLGVDGKTAQEKAMAYTWW